jgi:hypothetical protein
MISSMSSRSVGVPDRLGVDHQHRPLFATIEAAGGVDAHLARHFGAERLDLVLGVGAHVAGAVVVAAGFAGRALVGAEEHVMFEMAHGAGFGQKTIIGAAGI